MIRPEDAKPAEAGDTAEPARAFAGQDDTLEAEAERAFHAAEPELDVDTVQKLREVNQGVGWLGWAAGLSVLNVFFAASGADMSFALALAFSLVPTVVFHQAAAAPGMEALNVVGVVIGLVPAAILFGLVWLARRGKAWALLVALVMVLADTAVFALFQDWLSVLLHAACLWFTFRAWRAQIALDSRGARSVV